MESHKIKSDKLEYDYAIIGSGIAGLYTAYRLLQTAPKKSLVLFEKDNLIGGRIHTFQLEDVNIEAGAGRIQSKQTRILSLIRELGLEKNLIPISSSSYFVSKQGKVKDNNDIILKDIIKQIVEPTLRGGFSSTLVEHMRNITILEYAKDIVSKEEIQYLKNAFGYYSELVLMNAWDCIETLKLISLSDEGEGDGEGVHDIVSSSDGAYSHGHRRGSKSGFYVFKGGLSQIPKLLAQKIRKMGGVIMLNHSITNVAVSGDSVFELSAEVGSRQLVYRAKQCICALPVNAVQKLFLNSKYTAIANGLGSPEKLEDNLQKIHCAPLCRIYCRFEPDPSTGKVWFAGMPKITTNNALRMIIPINEENGVIMISYTDNKYADFWKNLKREKGMRAVSRELAGLIQKSLGVRIPMPKDIKIFYWKCGVGYWGVGANSHAISREMIQPFGSSVPLFVCGENYSEKEQQWMEGALDAADNVLMRLV